MYMNNFTHYQKYQRLYESAFVLGFFTLNALVLATSNIMEELATGTSELPFETWEPFLWEFSSALVIVALFPFVSRFLNSGLLSWSNPIRTACYFLVGSLVFSIVHIVAMVAIREIVYAFVGSDYNFGNPWFGFLYEYRKDIITFAVLIVVIQSYRFIVSRLRGEATLVQQGEDKPRVSDRILVKKLGKEFIVNISDVEWIEASGNYVNLHIGERLYPVRATMGSMIETLEGRGFSRIHRSYAVNLDFVDAIESVPGGGGDVVLKNERRLPISRKFHESMKRSLLRGST